MVVGLFSTLFYIYLYFCLGWWLPEIRSQLRPVIRRSSSIINGVQMMGRLKSSEMMEAEIKCRYSAAEKVEVLRQYCRIGKLFIPTLHNLSPDLQTDIMHMRVTTMIERCTRDPILK